MTATINRLTAEDVKRQRARIAKEIRRLQTRYADDKETLKKLNESIDAKFDELVALNCEDLPLLEKPTQEDGEDD